MDPSPKRRPWVKTLMVGLAIFVLAAVTMSYLFLVEWSEVIPARSPEAELAFAEAILAAGGGPPYIVIAADGTTVVHRDQETGTAPTFGALTLLAWSPGKEKLIRLDYPHWFVRLKTSSSLNLGTMIAFLSQDWENLDLSVTYQDLKRRGPALLLDHQLQNGARIMLWTSASGG